MAKQPLTFRQEETERILTLLAAGESAAVIGSSGMGKSNLFNHLLHADTQAHYGLDAAQFVFVRVNCHYAPEFTDRALYSLVLDALEMLGEGGDEMGQLHEALLAAGDDVLRRQRALRQAVAAVAGGHRRSQRRLVLLLDQFDDFYVQAEARLFRNLRGLREAYKYRLMFLTFTRDRLIDLAELDADREEFYELLAHNELGLGPYQPRDAHAMLVNISQRHQQPLDSVLADAIYALSGGHAGLHRAVYLTAVRHDNQLPADPIPMLLAQPDVALEAFKLWRGLSLAEQRVLAMLVQDTRTEEEEAALDSLQLKGLVTAVSPPVIFSPLFAQFVATQELNWDEAIQLDAQRRRVLVHGRTCPHLTGKEYALAEAFFQSPDTVLTYDELIDTVWPEAKGGVTNNNLATTVRRLRGKIEPDSKNPIFIETVAQHGYRLNTEP